MYVNKCTKCGAEFETKNPKRVICPNCLYPEKKSGGDAGTDSPESSQGQNQNGSGDSSQERPNSYSTGGYSSESYPRRDDRPRYDGGQRNFNQGGGYNQGRPQGGGYQNQGQGGYNRPQGGFNNNYDRPRPPRPYDRNDGYNRPQQGGYNQGPSQGGGYNRPQGGGYNRPQQGGYNQGPSQGGGYNRPQQGGYNQGPSQGGGYNRPPQGGGFNRPQQGGYNRPQGGFNQGQGGFNRGPRPMGGRPMQNRPPRQLLVDREQLVQIEELYKKMLPLPNPDAHEVIGEQINLEARKVFFGINLIRQKMMLPKLAFPKRKLAVSADQLLAIRMLYEPLLPLPPIGCHKIISAQLKIDEWRVHVGISLVRKQLGLDRWNPERADAPAEFKAKAQEAKVEETKVEEVKEETKAETVVEAEEKPVKKTRAKKKTAEPVEQETEAVKEDE